jgi:hypothetical protein
MSDTTTIQIICPCCGATLSVDPTLSLVLEHKPPPRARPVTELKDASKALKEEAGRRAEKYQQAFEAEKSKGRTLERKFQELLKKAKEEPLEKPLKDIDLD